MTKLVASALVLASVLSFSAPVLAQNLNNTASAYAAQQDRAQAVWSERVRSQSTSNAN